MLHRPNDGSAGAIQSHAVRFTLSYRPAGSWPRRMRSPPWASSTAARRMPASTRALAAGEQRASARRRPGGRHADLSGRPPPRRRHLSRRESQVPAGLSAPAVQPFSEQHALDSTWLTSPVAYIQHWLTAPRCRPSRPPAGSRRSRPPRSPGAAGRARARPSPAAPRASSAPARRCSPYMPRAGR